MARLSADELAATTLARQFPLVAGRDEAAVLALFERLGPVQSQVPRAPFLTASSRLPGTPFSLINRLFAEHRLLKTSNLRGTVHTSTRAHFATLDTLARVQWGGRLQPTLRLTAEQADLLMAELERFAADTWRTRPELVEHARDWLATQVGPEPAARLTGTFAENLVWGHSGLLRRPRDDRWDKRTDAFHRSARQVVDGLDLPTPEDALRGFVGHQLAALGPMSRADLAHLAGARLRDVAAAVAALGATVVEVSGPDGEPLVDLAGPPAGDPPRGTRLLPEFDALLVAYHHSSRTRFLTADQLDRVWARVNAQFAPMVLSGLRVVGQWRTVTRGRRTDVQVTLFDGPAPADLDDAVAAAATGLDLTVGDLDVRTGL